MKALILALLFTAQANAGVAKLSWTHDRRATDGSTVTLTGFKVYWGANGAPLTNVITLGPPVPLPWRVVGGSFEWAKTLDVATWVPGVTVCFQMTALAAELESDKTGQVCKSFPMDPNAPNLIDVIIP